MSARGYVLKGRPVCCAVFITPSEMGMFGVRIFGPERGLFSRGDCGLVSPVYVDLGLFSGPSARSLLTTRSGGSFSAGGSFLPSRSWALCLPSEETLWYSGGGGRWLGGW